MTTPPPVRRPEHSPVQLSRPGVILCEGRDDELFLQQLVRRLGLGETIQVIKTNGKDNLRRDLALLKAAPQWSEVRGLLITRDADEDYRAASQSLLNTIAACGLKVSASLNVPSVVSSDSIWLGTYVFPGGSRSGTLEDLCLEIAPNSSVLKCTDRYMECLRSSVSGEDRRSSYPAQPRKARLLAYLSGLPGVPNSIGRAAEQNAWDLEHPALRELRELLLELGSVCTYQLGEH